MMGISITKKTSTTNTTASQGRKILYIVEHYTAGVTSKSGSAANTASWFAQENAKASADFIVDDSNIVQFNPDPANRYCWAVGGSSYGNQGGSLYGVAKNANSISIEICSTNDTGKVTNANDSHWSFTDAVLNKAVELTKYLMEKYGIDADHVIRHYDVNGKPCPGIIGWNAETGDESKWKAFKARLTASSDNSTGLQATALKNLSEADVIKKVGALFTADQKSSGILASVSLAQFILESGYGKTDLAQEANNCFGMKKSLSGNTWSGSTWDGTSIYTKQTKEQKTDGTEYTVTADFRKYPCIEDSIGDHSAYLLGAMNGSVKRYNGLKGCTDYEKAIQIIKDGGYATDVSYVSKICSIIEKWNLTQYDLAANTTTTTETAKTNNSFPAVPFEVKVLVDDLNYRSDPAMGENIKGQTGKGVFTITKLSGSWGLLKSGAGWIWLGNASYCTILDTVQDAAFTPYKVKVLVDDLNIRKKPTIDGASVGYTGKGTFTIVAEKTGKVSKNGTTGTWGLLKSYADGQDGWVCLAFSEYTVKA
jgi:flagellum-specific peptidoglycan hydrolase FlgJ